MKKYIKTKKTVILAARKYPFRYDNYDIKDRKQALAKALDCNPDDISYAEDSKHTTNIDDRLSTFNYDDAQYLVLDEIEELQGVLARALEESFETGNYTYWLDSYNLKDELLDYSADAQLFETICDDEFETLVDDGVLSEQEAEDQRNDIGANCALWFFDEYGIGEAFVSFGYDVLDYDRMAFFLIAHESWDQIAEILSTEDTMFDAVGEYNDYKVFIHNANNYML